MNKQEAKIQTCILKVNIHCDGCKHKVKKLLQKIDGVFHVSIDSEQGRVTISGTVDPTTLIKKLEKSSKHAELVTSQKAASNNTQNNLNHTLKNVHLENLKRKKDKKGQKAKDHPKQQQQMKGSLKDQKMPPRDLKSVKFQLPDDDFDELGDEFDDDVFDDDDLDEDEYDDHGNRHHNPPSKIMLPVHGKGHKGIISKDVKKNGGKDEKKGGIFGILKGMGGNKNNDEKNVGKEKKGGVMSILKGMGGKNDGRKGGTKDGDSKIGKSGKKGSGNSNGGDENVPKEGKNKGVQAMRNGFHDFNGLNNHGKGGGQMGNFPAVQGLPAMNGDGYYPGMGMGMGGMNMMNPYNQQQQQQYMGMNMMNQQRSNGGEMFHPMMYARQPSPMGYMPPVMPPPPMADPFTHIFSDENTGSCNVM